MNLRAVSLGALLALAGAGAHAVRVNVTGFETEPPSELVVEGANVAYTGEAGEFSALLFSEGGASALKGPAGFRQILATAPGPRPTSFAAYCGELTQFVDFGIPHDYTRLGAAAQYGAAKAGDMSRLFTAAPSFVVDSSTSAAFQAALWEIIYETDGHYNLAAGTFTAVPESAGDAATAAALAQINGVLLNLGSFAPLYHVDALVNGEFQDLLVATGPAAVPEPSTGILFALGLLGVACGVRRRRSG